MAYVRETILYLKPEWIKGLPNPDGWSAPCSFEDIVFQEWLTNGDDTARELAQLKTYKEVREYRDKLQPVMNHDQIKFCQTIVYKDYFAAQGSKSPKDER